MIEKLIAALDLQRPSWYLDLADSQDLRTYIYSSMPNSMGETYFPEKLNRERLRRNSAERLFIVLRAAVHAGLVAGVEALQGALDSGEENAWDLIDVARAAHKAELQAAAAQRLLSDRIGGELEDADTLTQLDKLFGG